MKKIRTITFHSVLNYGAIIQTYALVKYLRNMGHDARLINYQPFYFINQVYRPSLGFLKTFQKIKKIIKFNNFRKQFIPQTRLYTRFNSLRNIHSDYFVCGSDQIWNKHITGNKIDKAFFLDFAATAAKRIAYAASSGHFKLDIEYNDLLRNFDSLGVREESLQQNIKEINGELVVHTVLDPCLLIEDYDDVLSTKKVPAQDYILSYCVGSGDTKNTFDHILEEVKVHSSLPIFHVGSHKSKYADVNYLDLSPSDWIGLFKNANFIITSSFHGMAISIKFQKNFITIPHSIKGLNSRQMTLLKSLDLESRQLNNKNDVERIYFESVNYINVNRKLLEIIRESKEFLDNSLK